MSTTHQVSRRNVAKGAAWAVPVIAVAAIVPKASASAADCSAVTVKATCAGNRGSQFCIKSTKPIPAGSTFGFSASVNAVVDPSVTPNFGGLAPYFTSAGSLASGWVLTAALTLPAGTQVCFTVNVGGGYIFSVVNTVNTLNINGGSNCAGGLPSDSTTISGGLLGGAGCSG